MTDKAIGTVYDISPEQASGRSIDQRSDLYSLGVMMYEMTTGTLPFNAENPVSVALMQVNDKPRRPRELNPDIPIGLEQIILGAMEKNPEHRFQSASQMLRHIEQLKSNPHFVFKTRRDETAALGDGKDNTAQNNNPAVNKKRKRRSESRSMLPIISGVTIAFLIVLGISAVYLLDSFLKNEEDSSPYTVTVPNYIGEAYDSDAVKSIDSTIYKVEYSYAYDETHNEGTVIRRIGVGEKRKVKANVQYCTLTLTISKGTETVRLPDYTNVENRTAESKIRALGLIPTLKYEFNPNIALGYVIRTDPIPRSELVLGTEVIVYVSRGPEGQTKVRHRFKA